MKMVLWFAMVVIVFVGVISFCEMALFETFTVTTQLASILAFVIVLRVAVGICFEKEEKNPLFFRYVFVLGSVIGIGSLMGILYFESFWPIAIGLLILGVWLVLIWIKEGKIKPTEVM